MKKHTTIPQSCCAGEGAVNLLTVADAEKRIMRALNPVNGVEVTAIRRAIGRIVSEDVVSKINVPPHTNSAMDGYAVNSADIKMKSGQLKVIATAYAGQPYQGVVQRGQCVRVMTGAILPEGVDTVIMQEHVERHGDMIRFESGQMPGQNVRKAGEDLAVGQVAIAAGKKISPAELGLLASMGVAELKVWRKPRVAFFSTGDELRSIVDPLDKGEIYDSNRYTLYGMISRLPVELVDMGVIPDNPDALRDALNAAAGDSDVVITTGGVSVGEADYIKDVLAELGQVDFWKLAIKPGRPLAFGKVKNAAFFGLPGNPVAVMVTFYQFVQPAIKRLMGQAKMQRQRFKVACVSKITKKAGRVEYIRGTLDTDESGGRVVRKTGAQGSGMLSSMSKANCFIVLPAECESIEAGQLVDVEPFEGMV